MNDSDSNIVRSLLHEHCSAHCPGCDACLDDPTCCENCGWDADAPVETEPHNLGQCLCDTCDEDRAEARRMENQ